MPWLLTLEDADGDKPRALFIGLTEEALLISFKRPGRPRSRPVAVSVAQAAYFARRSTACTRCSPQWEVIPLRPSQPVPLKLPATPELYLPRFVPWRP